MTYPVGALTASISSTAASSNTPDGDGIINGLKNTDKFPETGGGEKGALIPGNAVRVLPMLQEPNVSSWRAGEDNSDDEDLAYLLPPQVQEHSWIKLAVPEKVQKPRNCCDSWIHDTCTVAGIAEMGGGYIKLMAGLAGLTCADLGCLLPLGIIIQPSGCLGWFCWVTSSVTALGVGGAAGAGCAALTVRKCCYAGNAIAEEEGFEKKINAALDFVGNGGVVVNQDKKRSEKDSGLSEMVITNQPRKRAPLNFQRLKQDNALTIAGLKLQFAGEPASEDEDDL